MTDTPTDIVDVTIIGGGPTGLAAAYYAGHREASVRIIDILPELGGMVMTTYPQKHIYDVAGHPKVLGAELIRLQVEQAMQFDPDVVLNENCETLEYVRAPEGEVVDQLIRLTGSSGRVYWTRTLIIAAGHGAFRPKKLPELPGLEQWEGRGLHYLVREKDAFAGKRVVIVGGGDSALDWTLGLQDTAAEPITLVHRRDAFRAFEHSVSQMRDLAGQGKVNLLVPCTITGVEGNGRIEAVRVHNRETDSETEVPCDALLLLIGFSSSLGSIAEWGVELAGKRQLKVNPGTMETNLPNVFAAGDGAGYEGKITLITVDMGEAAIAANRAITRVRPDEKLQPQYSTE